MAPMSLFNVAFVECRWRRSEWQRRSNGVAGAMATPAVSAIAVSAEERARIRCESAPLLSPHFDAGVIFRRRRATPREFRYIDAA